MKKIQLTPSELQAQAKEMQSLQEEYASFFSGVSTELKSINGHWSPNLSNNFEGKINSAQKSFAVITQELMTGANVANTCAVTFESVDSQLAKFYSGEATSASSTTAASVWDVVKEEFADIPEDAKDAGEALQWLEEKYGEIPNEFRLLINAFIPDSLETAYSATSDLLQGNFGEGLYDIAKTICEKSPYASALVETFKYGFEKGTDRIDEMDAEIMAQIKEGDILGAAFDGAEGFIDTIVAGSVECLFSTGGTMLDAVMGDIPGVKLINEGSKLITGWITGTDGYTVGDMISGVGDKVSDVIDGATDVITDVTDTVTSGITSGVKAVGNWIGSWF